MKTCTIISRHNEYSIDIGFLWGFLFLFFCVCLFVCFFWFFLYHNIFLISTADDQFQLLERCFQHEEKSRRVNSHLLPHAPNASCFKLLYTREDIECPGRTCVHSDERKLQLQSSVSVSYTHLRAHETL